MILVLCICVVVFYKYDGAELMFCILLGTVSSDKNLLS